MEVLKLGPQIASEESAVVYKTRASRQKDKTRRSKNRDIESIIGEDSKDGDAGDRTDVYGKITIDDVGRSNSLNPIESRESLYKQGS